jgi:hypothetical protein
MVKCCDAKEVKGVLGGRVLDCNNETMSQVYESWMRERERERERDSATSQVLVDGEIFRWNSRLIWILNYCCYTLKYVRFLKFEITSQYQCWSSKILVKYFCYQYDYQYFTVLSLRWWHLKKIIIKKFNNLIIEKKTLLRCQRKRNQFFEFWSQFSKCTERNSIILKCHQNKKWAIFQQAFQLQIKSNSWGIPFHLANE